MQTAGVSPSHSVTVRKSDAHGVYTVGRETDLVGFIEEIHGVSVDLAGFGLSPEQHEGIGSELPNQFVDSIGITLGEDFMAVVSQRKGQKLGYFRRIVDQQNTAQP